MVTGTILFLLLSSSGKTETNLEWPSEVDEIQSLEYYLEFTPTINDIYVAGYTLNFSASDEIVNSVGVKYCDPSITTASEDFDYYLYKDSKTILGANSTVYDEYFTNHTSELFCNLTNIGENQTFRVDEMVTFNQYFRTSAEPDLIEDHELEFEYIGTEDFGPDDKWLTSFTTHHYNASFSWIGAGCA
jgi:hypothetical protein